MQLADGRRVFAKVALDDVAAGWLRAEHRVYAGVTGSFVPELVGWHDEEVTLLAIEDLTEAHWPPPWNEELVAAVLAGLEELHAALPPAKTPLLESNRDQFAGWTLVAADPEPLLSTGVCSAVWLERALPLLLEAAATAPLDGNSLLHLDVRSDNLCFVDSRVKLVDWNLAHAGNPAIDVAFWLPSLALEGGPQPWEVLAGAGPFASVVAGFFACRAGLEPPPGAPTVRDFQRRQLEVALPWAARELGLTSPAD